AVRSARDTIDLIFFVVGDINTPAGCQEACAAFNRFCECHYVTPAEQEIFLQKVNFPSELIPYKSDNRRNVGFLMALEAGCDMIVSIDDDNFPVNDHFFQQHSIVGENLSGIPTATNNRWFNPMSLLNNAMNGENPVHVYPRGFAYDRRWNDNSRIDQAAAAVSGKLGINVGLWTGDPDIDAVTRITTRCVSSAGNWNGQPHFILGKHQLMPINTQNTCVTAEAIVCYYFVRMGFHINGMKMDRFGDIFSGYFLLLCNHSVGNLVAIGQPLVNQVRNEHNLLKDLQVELPGMLVIEELIPYLEEGLPATGSYYEAYDCLGEKLKEFTSSPVRSGFWSGENLAFIHETIRCMDAWKNSCRIIKGYS
ncbi:MAG: hypothetical protein WCF67_16645, partial [Chitinophagaceae bacterium]